MAVLKTRVHYIFFGGELGRQINIINVFTYTYIWSKLEKSPIRQQRLIYACLALTMYFLHYGGFFISDPSRKAHTHNAQRTMHVQRHNAHTNPSNPEIWTVESFAHPYPYFFSDPDFTHISVCTSMYVQSFPSQTSSSLLFNEAKKKYILDATAARWAFFFIAK